MSASWPRVQVQASDGQWRAEPDWPQTGGPAGQLALGTGGELGASAPTGSTTIMEGLGEGIGTGSAVFVTPAVNTPLHLTGQPILDLWATLSLPDAHIEARLEVLDPDGGPMSGAVSFGYRSARHLDPMPNGTFDQRTGRTPPTGMPLNIPIRFLPGDLRVPAGGRLRLTVSGPQEGALASGLNTSIGILHDCEHPSALRFLIPGAEAKPLNVQEFDEKAMPTDNAAPRVAVDGGGIAAAPLCGAAPKRLQPFMGAERGAADPLLATATARLSRRGGRVRLAPTDGATLRKLRLSLRRGKRTVARARVDRITRTRSIRIKGRLRRGRYTFVITGSNPDDRTGRLTLRLRVR